MTKRTLQKAFGKFDGIKKRKDPEVPAILGFTVNGVNTVEVGNRSGFVWARIRNNQNEVVQAYNDQVSPVYGLPVILVRDEVDRVRYRIKGKDLGVYQNWGNAPYLPRHGNQHSFNPEGGGGGDVTFVYSRQFMPLAVIPSGSAGGGNVYIQPYGYYQDAQYKYAGGTGSASFLPYKPTGSNARMVLVYIDGYGNPQLLPGSDYFDSNITGNAAVLPFVPVVSGATDIPIAAVRLVSGTNTILWDNIYDLRPFFVGEGFASSPASSELPIFEDGVFQVSGTAINFTDNLDVIVSGSVAHVSSQGGGVGAGLNVLGIFDDSTFKVSGSAISFDSNLTVAVTGSVAFVSSSGAGSDIGARVTRTSDFIFTGTAFDIGIPVPFTSERWDTDNIHSGSSTQLYCNTAGYYLIAGNVSFAPASITYRLLAIKLNNGNFIAEVRQPGAGVSVYQDMHISCVQYLNVGDYVRLYVDRSTASADTISRFQDYSPEFMMHKL